MTNSSKPSVIVIGGTAGTGKSTIGERLAKFYQDRYPGIEFLEGDNIHPPENIAKMAQGIPLQDEDRWGWLTKVAELSTESAKDHCGLSIISCSSLKLLYRNHIRKTCPDTNFYFLFMYAHKEEILNRLTKREGHFMKPNMIGSQFSALQLPKEDETNSLVIDVEGKSIEQVLEEVLLDANQFLPY